MWKWKKKKIRTTASEIMKIIQRNGNDDESHYRLHAFIPFISLHYFGDPFVCLVVYHSVPFALDLQWLRNFQLNFSHIGHRLIWRGEKHDGARIRIFQVKNVFRKCSVSRKSKEITTLGLWITSNLFVSFFLNVSLCSSYSLAAFPTFLVVDCEKKYDTTITSQFKHYARTVIVGTHW